MLPFRGGFRPSTGLERAERMSILTKRKRTTVVLRDIFAADSVVDLRLDWAQ